MHCGAGKGEITMLTLRKDGALPEGEWRHYIKIVPTPMLQMDEDFRVETPEGIMQGYAGDFLALDCQGGMYVVSAGVHMQTYVLSARRES